MGHDVLCVDNMMKAFMRTIDTDDSFTGPVDLGNPVEFSLLQLAELVIELTDPRPQRTFLPLPVDDPRQRQPDISLAKEVLDWPPRVAMREGLGATISYFDRLLGGPAST
jgi:UDP-glucuronate decarboxylase